MSRKTPHSRAIDLHVGQRIRLYRLQQGLSQQELADKLGISYQQLHKYENGSNSISAGRMADVARVLGTEPALFFLGLGEESATILSQAGDREAMLFSNYVQEILPLERRQELQKFVCALAKTF
tara:strand:+ start:282 stop:653 length:372 start_codon:yes stop_codon:yes gene_type:complete